MYAPRLPDRTKAEREVRTSLVQRDCQYFRPSSSDMCVERVLSNPNPKEVCFHRVFFSDIVSIK